MVSTASFRPKIWCKEYLVKLRWPDGVRCPRCGNEKVYKLKQAFRWQCQKCAPKGYRFGPRVGTIFMDTKIALKTWFKVAYMMLQSKKGISALQIHRMMAQSDGQRLSDLLVHASPSPRRDARRYVSAQRRSRN